MTAKTRRDDRRGRRPREPKPTMRKQPRTSAGSTIVDAIVDTAERVLEREGLAALTTNHVAEQAGVSIGTLYQYFPNKFALAAAIFDRQLVQYEAAFAAAVATSRSPYEIITAIGGGLAEALAAKPNIHRSLRYLRSAAEVHERIDAMLDKMIAGMTTVLEAQSIPTERASDLAFVLVHGADGIANAIANSADPERGRRVTKLFAEMALLFYAPR
jgi:AcrR family transcriptional regulator